MARMIDADLLERRIMTTYFDGETKVRILEIIDSLVKDPELAESEDEQAEKDLALTWEDMQKIHEIICGIDAELESLPYGLCYQEYWEEVLRRFNETREKK